MIEHLICKALKEAIFQSLVQLWSAQVLTHCPVILGAFNSVLTIGPYGPILSVWSPEQNRTEHGCLNSRRHCLPVGHRANHPQM